MPAPRNGSGGGRPARRAGARRVPPTASAPRPGRAGPTSPNPRKRTRILPRERTRIGKTPWERQGGGPGPRAPPAPPPPAGGADDQFGARARQDLLALFAAPGGVLPVQLA